ncbi:hypothetical protein F5883DRAFT_723040 [Diaporthe sp. PMI_573]|nr:hypothetical protein F5883DRAFT_723040 [Diaporthaceae sp. PMI_573]
MSDTNQLQRGYQHVRYLDLPIPKRCRRYARPRILQEFPYASDAEALTKYGLKRWTLSELLPNADGSPLPYVFYGVIELESAEQLQAAFLDAAGDEMANDVKNYTSVKPVMLVGKIVRDVQVW